MLLRPPTLLYGAAQLLRILQRAGVWEWIELVEGQQLTQPVDLKLPVEDQAVVKGVFNTLAKPHLVLSTRGLNSKCDDPWKGYISTTASRQTSYSVPATSESNTAGRKEPAYWAESITGSAPVECSSAFLLLPIQESSQRCSNVSLIGININV